MEEVRANSVVDARHTCPGLRSDLNVAGDSCVLAQDSAVSGGEVSVLCAIYATFFSCVISWTACPVGVPAIIPIYSQSPLLSFLSQDLLPLG